MFNFSAYRVYILTRFIQALLLTVIGAYTSLYRINIVHLNPLQLILVGTVLEITTFIFEVPTGIVADVFSRKASTAIGVMLVGLGFAFESLFPYFFTVLIAQVIWGIGFTFISGAREAWVTGEIGTEKAQKAFFKATQFAQMGAFIGVLISMILALVNVGFPIFIGGILMFVWGIVLFLVMPEKHFISTKPAERNNWHHMLHTLKAGIAIIRFKKILMFMVIGGGIYGVFSEAFDRLWTVHLLKNYSFPTFVNLSQTTWFGIIYLLALIVSYFAVKIVSSQVKHESERSVVINFLNILIALFVSTICFAFAPNMYMLAIFSWLIYGLREATGPLINGVISKEAHDSSRATVFSIMSQANALGQIVGGPIIGAIATYYAIRIGMVGAAVSLIPVIILLYVAYTRLVKVHKV